MPTSGQHDSGPAGPSDPLGGYTLAFSSAPPKYSQHKSNRAVEDCTASLPYVDERRPLLCRLKLCHQPGATSIFSIIFLLCLLLYFIIPGPSDAVDYKPLYHEATARIQRLEQKNAALEGDVHDLREHLTNSKVSAFWEIARTMHTSMCVPRYLPFTLLMARLRDVWVGADDPGGDPKFWPYGITSGLFNDNDPLVTSIKLHFAADQAATIESTEYRRIVGYKVESNRWNNGWWFATGLFEFGQSGSHEVKFSAKPSINGAEYEVTVFFADWKL
jgi:hypothetical protein